VKLLALQLFFVLCEKHDSFYCKKSFQVKKVYFRQNIVKHVYIVA